MSLTTSYTSRDVHRICNGQGSRQLRFHVQKRRLHNSRRAPRISFLQQKGETEQEPLRMKQASNLKASTFTRMAQQNHYESLSQHTPPECMSLSSCVGMIPKGDYLEACSLLAATLRLCVSGDMPGYAVTIDRGAKRIVGAGTATATEPTREHKQYATQGPTTYLCT